MQKTLLVTLEYPPMHGGVGRYLFDLHNGMEGVSVCLLKRSWRLWPRWMPMIFEVWAALWKEKSRQIVISHVLPVGYIALLAKWFCGLPFIVFVHGLDVLRAAKNPWKRFWLKKILSSAKCVVANSEFTKELALRYGAQRCEVILPCIKSVPETEHGFKNRTLLSVGRLVSRKNHLAVIEVLPELLKQFSDLEYIIIGDGPAREAIKKKIQELGVENAVRLITKASDQERDDYYQKASIFVLPTKSEGDDVEGFGIVFLEAARYGKPVIAGQGGGVDEAVKDGQTGILVDPTSFKELKDAIARFLRDSDLARKMGQAGRARVEKDFLCADRHQQLKQLYS